MTAPFTDPRHDVSDSSVPDGFRVYQIRHERNSKYVLPSEEESEINRLDLQHYAFRNFNAPIDDELEEGIKVLDAGCGTGIWSLAMAQDFPRSTFVGTDITLTSNNPAPPNCTFIITNTLKGLPFEDNTRMGVAFDKKDWPIAIKELIRVTKPRGYIELVKNVMLERGVDYDCSNLVGLLAELEDVQSDYVSFPIGWQGKAGDLARQNCEIFVENMRSVVQPILNYTDEQYDDMALTIHSEWAKYKTWGNVLYAYGRKKANHVS
ncbi:hypothetical protein BC937DRAFT_90410 [Endogone sp. FLAS-F59071]|nr:hypothetical protein BC937DRAFT_90410 [Endogone sp. FLAS-F59071]|eukprot:RUS17105.1 hypothetical protein BC937DRAFT_90410 [Endogone sp. FLAS-F59071]